MRRTAGNAAEGTGKVRHLAKCGGGGGGALTLTREDGGDRTPLSRALPALSICTCCGGLPEAGRLHGIALQDSRLAVQHTGQTLAGLKRPSTC